MRFETCLTCRHPDAAGDRQLRPLVVVAESLSGLLHHHHAVRCEGCGGWWFDDVVTGPLGVPVPARRDTMMCDCPEDGRRWYTRTVILVPAPEEGCHCTAAMVERYALPVRMGGAR